MVKKLLIVNFLLLTALFVGIGMQVSGAHDFLGINEMGLSEEFLDEFEEVKEFVLDQKEAQEFVSSSEELEDTLANETGLEGYVDLRGYLVTEIENLFGEDREKAYFAFSEATDETMFTALDVLVDQGNSVNRKNGSTYYLGLGCTKGDTVENHRFTIGESSYNELKDSSSSNKVMVRAFFTPDNFEGGGACLTYASGLQIIN
jgi:hypothetical protein